MAAIRLSAAVERYRQEESAPSNSYEWYRKQAQRDGKVRLGGLTIPARKKSGAWVVDEEDVGRSLDAHRQRIAERKSATLDYESHVLRGSTGATTETTWGYYTIRGEFHLVTANYIHPLKGNTSWKCNTCWRPASTEHNREECHTCSDWGGCRRDCTLSRVYCDHCGTSLDIP